MRLEARGTRCRGRCLQRLLRRGHHAQFVAGKGRVAGLGRLQGAAHQAGQGRCGQLDAVTAQDGQGLGASAGVGHAGAAADDAGVVARHVADGQGQHPGRRASRRQSPALDAREMLAHAIHLPDVGAAVEQLLVDALLVTQIQTLGGQRQQGRSTAGYQAQHQVIGAQALRQLQHALRSRQAGRVGHRVRRLDHLDAPGQTAWSRRHMLVARHHQAGQRRIGGPQRLHRLRHGPASLARAQHQGAALGRARQAGGGVVQRQGTLHSGLEKMLEKFAGMNARVGRHAAIVAGRRCGSRRYFLPRPRR